MSKINLFNPNEAPREMPLFEKQKAVDDPDKYIFNKGLINAVNVAVFLGQPLLITGEPGTGKSQLADAVAHYLKAGKLLVFNTKTTATAKDMLYYYDSLAHFQYIQTHEERPDDAEIEKLFIHYEAFGTAIKDAIDKKKRRVVLIDEIDKAPRDFPNDILNVLEKMEFEVPEIHRTGEKCFRATPEYRPVLIITSNSEKNLPDAFLRRCVFYHIEFPSDDKLLEILRKKVISANYTDEQWNEVIKHFRAIRKKVKRKMPATAELIFWASLLAKNNFDVAKLNKPDEQNDDEKENLKMTYSVLAKTADDLKLL